MKMEIILSEYVNKHDLLQMIEADIAEGKIAAAMGNALLRYIQQLPVGNAVEIVETAKREVAAAEYLDACRELGAAVGRAWRKSKEYAEVIINAEKR